MGEESPCKRQVGLSRGSPLAGAGRASLGHLPCPHAPGTAQVSPQQADSTAQCTWSGYPAVQIWVMDAFLSLRPLPLQALHHVDERRGSPKWWGPQTQTDAPPPAVMTGRWAPRCDDWTGRLRIACPLQPRLLLLSEPLTISFLWAEIKSLLL